jgi:aminoglycoside phosphotransferase (APT) family kinase protein
MVRPPPSPLSDEAVLALLKEVAPGSALLNVELLPGSLSNYTHLVRARMLTGDELDLVLRRYAVFGDYDRGEKARREFKAIELAHAEGIPTPEPILLDEGGAILGSPGIVAGFVVGSLRMDPPPNALAWAREMAVTLAHIHAVPCGPEGRRFLLDANAEASWFARSADAPAYMAAFPGGEQVWQIFRDLYPRRKAVKPGLVHIDYWPGNILWLGDTISAVLDWEEAAWGDPAIDVAYARMHLALIGFPAPMDQFLSAYETGTGQPLANLGLWELAAAVRPMFDAEGWEVTKFPKRERLQDFVAAATKRALEGS